MTEFVPHKYQEHSIQYVLNHERCGLILDMGLGKTVITLTAIQELMYDRFEISKVLIVAPLRVAQYTWRDEIEKWGHLNLTISTVVGTKKQRETALETRADIYIINRENVVWLYKHLGKDFDFDMLVIDEWSSFKDPSSKRFKALRVLAPYCKRFIGLTGTPSSNGYMDLWSQMYLLDQGERLGKTIGSYRMNYFDAGRRNGYVVYDWALKPGAPEIIQEKMSDVCISLQAKDWLEVPERVDQEIYVELDQKDKARYQEFERTNFLLFTEDKALIGTHAGALTNKLLQFANGAVYDEEREVIEIHDKKLEALEELVEAAKGEPILVFYSYKHDLERIQREFPFARTLQCEEDFKAWNKGEIPMLVCHPASMGHGLNMQDGGSVIVWFGLNWSLELYQQANARLHRQGQTKSVRVYHILTKDTHDEDVMGALKKKEVSQNGLIEAIKVRINGARKKGGKK